MMRERSSKLSGEDRDESKTTLVQNLCKRLVPDERGPWQIKAQRKSSRR